MIQDAIPSWHLSQHEFFSNKFGDSVSCCRSCLYVSPIPLPTPSLFSPPLPPSFPNTSPCLSPIFNSPSFNLLTTINLSSLQASTSTCTLFNMIKIYDFTNDNDTNSLTSNLEPKFTSSDDIFDGWFGILFLSDHSLTHIRAPHPTEILTLYRLDALTLLYPTTISSSHIRLLVFQKLYYETYY